MECNMTCSRKISCTVNGTKLSDPVPWMRCLENGALIGQLGAAYQSTRLEHEMNLDVNSKPKPAKLTKIMVTLGNVTYVSSGTRNSHPDGIADIIMAGANIVRLNMSHEEEKWHAITVQSIREAGNRIYESTCEVYPLGVAMDLRGPEIRTGVFRGDPQHIDYAKLEAGNTVVLTTDDIAKRAGCASCFWVSYPDLPRICHPGDTILIDRGTVSLTVTCIRETSVICKITKSGVVRNARTVQLVDSAVALPQISKKDDADIKLSLVLECDFLIINNARNAKMIYAIKNRIKQIGINPICVLAKISSQPGVEHFDDILQAADGILLDTGALEVDVKAEKLFLVQKRIVATCIRIGKPIMLAFRPHENARSQIDTNLIATAVLDGVDGIFLATGSLNAGETVELVKAIDLLCKEAESARWQRQIFEELSYKVPIPLDPCHAIAVGAVETSLKSDAAAIIVTTTTGRSAVLISIYRPRCPILAITRYGIVSRWLQVYYGVHPLHYRVPPLPDWSKDMEGRIQTGIDSLRKRQYVSVGDAVVVVSGWRQGTGFTNCIRVIYASPGHSQNQVPDFEICW